MQPKAYLLHVKLQAHIHRALVDTRKIHGHFRHCKSVEFDRYDQLMISCNQNDLPEVMAVLQKLSAEITNVERIHRVIDNIYKHPSNLYRVSSGDGKYCLMSLERYITEYELDMDPEFQRGYVWTEAQQISYVEYLLSGGTSGREIYFNQAGWMSKTVGRMVLVDGKQRITAVMRFLKGEITVFGGVTLEDLRYSDAQNLELYFNVNDLDNESDVIRWYLSMNTGGSVHTETDLAKAKIALENALLANK